MRRLIVEIPIEGASSGKHLPLRMMKTLEVLQFLRHDRNGFAVILRVELVDQDSDIEDLVNLLRTLHGVNSEVEVLDRGETSYTLFMKREAPWNLHGFISSNSVRGYMTTPFEVKNGKLKVTFLGNVKELKRLMNDFANSGVRYRVVAMTDARFSPDSPLGSLTEKQRRVLLLRFGLAM